MTSARPASAVREVTGPRHAHSSAIACGPRSHRAPLSVRHGVLNGLDSCSDEPSQTKSAPVQRSWPPVTPASQARNAGWKSSVKKTTDATWAASTASTSAPPAATEVAIGFSSSRCLPAAAARAARAACTSGGTANATPSTAARNSSKSA